MGRWENYKKRKPEVFSEEVIYMRQVLKDKSEFEEKLGGEVELLERGQLSRGQETRLSDCLSLIERFRLDDREPN